MVIQNDILWTSYDYEEVTVAGKWDYSWQCSQPRWIDHRTSGANIQLEQPTPEEGSTLTNGKKSFLT